MKKIFASLLCCILGCIGGNAQDTLFAPVGAEWHYMDYEKMYNIWAGEQIPDKAWNDHVTSIGDTSINGKDCRVLEIIRKYRYGANGPVQMADPSYQFVYDNTDTTFYYDLDSLRFLPLYVWNVQAGDTVSLPHLNRINHVFSFVVDSIVDMPYDNVYLKTYYTSSYADSTGYYGIPNWGGHIIYPNDENIAKSVGFYTKKLGGHKSLFPSVKVINPDGASEIPTPGGSILCYKDADINLHFSATMACDTVPRAFYTSIGNIAHAKVPISIFPNPAADRVNVQGGLIFETDSWLTVSDITGRVMMPAIALDKKQQVNIDVSQWSSGIYLMKFKIGTDTYYQKVNVRH